MVSGMIGVGTGCIRTPRWQDLNHAIPGRRSTGKWPEMNVRFPVSPEKWLIGESPEGGDISPHHAEEVSVFGLVAAGGDDHAGEADFFQFLDVPGERIALPDEERGPGVLFPDSGQGRHVFGGEFHVGFP